MVLGARRETWTCSFAGLMEKHILPGGMLPLFEAHDSKDDF